MQIVLARAVGRRVRDERRLKLSRKRAGELGGAAGRGLCRLLRRGGGEADSGVVRVRLRVEAGGVAERLRPARRRGVRQAKRARARSPRPLVLVPPPRGPVFLRLRGLQGPRRRPRRYVAALARVRARGRPRPHQVPLLLRGPRLLGQAAPAVPWRHHRSFAKRKAPLFIQP